MTQEQLKKISELTELERCEFFSIISEKTKRFLTSRKKEYEIIDYSDYSNHSNYADYADLLRTDYAPLTEDKVTKVSKLLYPNMVITPYPRDAIYSWILNYSKEFTDDFITEMVAQDDPQTELETANPLILCVRNKEHKILDLLLKLHHKYDIINDSIMTSALYLAAELDDPIACNLILPYDFDLDFSDHESLLRVLIDNESYLACNTILGHPRVNELVDMTNGTDRDPMSPLLYCVKKNKINFAKLILQAGADPNVKYKMFLTGNGLLEERPLSQILIDDCDVKWLELFVKYGLDIHSKYSDELNSRTPILYAASKGDDCFAVKVLLINGADPTVIDSKGNDLLDLLLRSMNNKGETPVLQFVLKYKSVRDLWNRPLKKRPKIFEIRLFTTYTFCANHGMDVTQTFGSKQIPFLLWCYMSDETVDFRIFMLRAIIASGVPVTVTDSLGNNVLHYMAKCKGISKDEIQYCIDCGLGVNQVNNAGERPADLAVNSKVRKLLE